MFKHPGETQPDIFFRLRLLQPYFGGGGVKRLHIGFRQYSAALHLRERIGGFCGKEAAAVQAASVQCLCTDGIGWNAFTVPEERRRAEPAKRIFGVLEIPFQRLGCVRFCAAPVTVHRGDAVDALCIRLGVGIGLLSEHPIQSLAVFAVYRVFRQAALFHELCDAVGEAGRRIGFFSF